MATGFCQAVEATRNHDRMYDRHVRRQVGTRLADVRRRKQVTRQADRVIALCVAGAPAGDIQRALEHLAILTGHVKVAGQYVHWGNVVTC